MARQVEMMRTTLSVNIQPWADSNVVNDKFTIRSVLFTCVMLYYDMFWQN